MSDLKISAETRTEFGKGAARRLRREGKIPAVLYGHGSDPIHVALPGHASTMALKHANALLEITTGSETLLGIPRQIQRDPLRGDIEHVDLLIVKKGEKVTVEIPLTHTGTPASGTLVVTVVTQIFPSASSEILKGMLTLNFSFWRSCSIRVIIFPVGSTL